MLGQSKSVYQAGSTHELMTSGSSTSLSPTDFRRQPIQWRERIDYRPLDRFRLRDHAVQLHLDRRQSADRPRLTLGRTVIWKPSITQTLAAYLTMQLLEAAGCRPG